MNLNERSRVAKNAVAGTISQAMMIGVGLITTPIILHSLGNTLYGTYAIVSSLTAYFGIIDFGIGGSLTRFMSFHHERCEYDRIRSHATFGLLFYATVTSVLLPIILVGGPGLGRFLDLPPPVQEGFSTLLVMVLALFMGWSLNGILIARLSAAHRLDLSAYVSMVGSMTFVILAFTIVPIFRNVEVVLLCMIGQIAIVGIGLLVVDRRLNGPLLTSVRAIRWRETKEMFSFGLWAQASSVSSVVNMEADKFIISREIGVDQVTPYHVANRLALLSRALPLQFLMSLLPAVTAQVSRGLPTEEIASLYERAARSLMIPTLIIVGFIAAATEPLLRLWLGAYPSEALFLCIALVISYSVNNATGAGTVILKAEGAPQLETFYGILSAALNIIITIALITPFGLAGVVMGTIAGNVIGSVVFIGLFHRRKQIKWWGAMGCWLTKLVLAVSAAGAVTHGFLLLVTEQETHRLLLIPVLTLAGLAYLALCLAIGRFLDLWTESDRVAFNQVVTKIGWGRSDA